MNSIWEDIKSTFKKGSVLIKLIYINLAVFVVIALLRASLYLFQADDLYNLVSKQLMIPAHFKNLIYQPWSIITYMFLHEGFLHILFNLLWLYWFGKIFMQYIQEKALLSVYLLGGLSGAFLYIVAYNLFPVFQPALEKSYMLGASAAVYAIIVSTAVFVPGHKIHLLIIGQVEIKYIALIAIASDIIQLSDNPGGHIAHLGGAIFGVLFALQYKKGLDITKGFGNFLNGLFSIFKKKKKIKVTHKKGETDWEYNKRKTGNQDEVDRILEKIKKSGYNSLNKNEKETLFRMSNNDKNS